jgi:hypothetical protein
MQETNTNNIEPLYTKKIVINNGQLNWSEMFDVNQDYLIK